MVPLRPPRGTGGQAAANENGAAGARAGPTLEAASRHRDGDTGRIDPSCTIKQGHGLHLRMGS